jgi:hypothetical protein
MADAWGADVHVRGNRIVRPTCALDCLKLLPPRPGRKFPAQGVRLVSVPWPRLNGTRLNTLLLRATTRAKGVGHW